MAGNSGSRPACTSAKPVVSAFMTCDSSGSRCVVVRCWPRASGRHLNCGSFFKARLTYMQPRATHKGTVDTVELILSNSTSITAWPGDGEGNGRHAVAGTKPLLRLHTQGPGSFLQSVVLSSCILVTGVALPSACHTPIAYVKVCCDLDVQATACQTESHPPSWWCHPS